MHFADRLLSTCRQKGNAVCVGIDPRWDLLPVEIRRRHAGGTLDAMAASFEEFSLRVLDISQVMQETRRVNESIEDAGINGATTGDGRTVIRVSYSDAMAAQSVSCARRACACIAAIAASM